MASRRFDVTAIGNAIVDVLAQADVSIAMGEGALVARTQADAVLVSNRLGDIVRARTLAVKTLRIVRQNLAWDALYNGACVPFALAANTQVRLAGSPSRSSWKRSGHSRIPRPFRSKPDA